MELWIRSQDKNSLIKVENIYSDVLPEDGYYKIFNMPDEDILGKYITKERALEVLDEIQHILNPIVDRKILEIEQKDLLNGTNFIQPKLKDIEISEFNTYVYEMPKE
jgi:hypothetical protein